jgi:hypothetical protein
MAQSLHVCKNHSRRREGAPHPTPSPHPAPHTATGEGERMKDGYADYPLWITLSVGAVYRDAGNTRAAERKSNCAITGPEGPGLCDSSR